MKLPDLKNINLKTKLIGLYIILLIIPLVIISVTIYRQVTTTMMSKIQYSAEKGYIQSKKYLEYKISQVIKISDIIVMDSNIRNIVANLNTSTNLSQEQLIEQTMQQANIRSVFHIVDDGSYDYKMYVDDNFIFSEDNTYIFKRSEAENTLWYKKKGTSKIYFAPGIFLEEEQKDKSIALVRDIVNLNNYRDVYGVLRVDIDAETIEDILENATPTSNSITFLINEDNIVLAASNHDCIFNTLTKSYISQFFDLYNYRESNTLQNITIDDEKYHVILDNIQDTDWHMVTVIPHDELKMEVVRIQSTVAGMFMLFGIISVVYFLIVISWTKNLIEDKYILEIELKNAELIALQSQINPHFLYNTLEMVNWLAINGSTLEINKTVIALSKYYKLILNNGNELLTIEEELQHVLQYIKIQELRYPEAFQYIERVDSEIKVYKIPKIILQPLVENAIYHGILAKEEKKGTLIIEGSEKSNGDIELVVRDNGIGMQCSFDKILSGDVVTSGSGYGIRNVHERLQLTFGSQYGLQYEKNSTSGTNIIITIAKIE